MALVVGNAGSSAFAQDLFVRAEQVIYRGDPSSRSGIKLGGWGSGMCEESTLHASSGSRSLKVTPKNLYAGGRIDFTNPVDLAKSFNMPDAYLQLEIKFGGTRSQYESWAVGLAPPGATDMYAGTTSKGKPVRRVRIMLCLDGGQKLESQVDLNGFMLSGEGWMTVSLPLAVLKGSLDLSEYKLRRLVIAGDGTVPFHIGEIRTIRDTTPLQADAGEEKEVAKNYNIAFHSTCRSGASAVKYSWDFDEQDGIQEEAVGDLVYHRFRKPGNLVVTLTVSDVFGLKEPSTSIINVKVNE